MQRIEFRLIYFPDMPNSGWRLYSGETYVSVQTPNQLPDAVAQLLSSEAALLLRMADQIHDKSKEPNQCP